VIIDHGKVIADDDLQGLHRMLPISNLLTIQLATGANGLRTEDLRLVPGVESLELRGAVLKIGLRDLGDSPRILQWLVERGHPFEHMASEPASLESVFLTLTGRSLRD
jgi:ABC-2 type transport system ATP-binding protein